MSVIGTFALVSFEVRSEGSPTIHPLGKDALGQLVYTEDGRMSALLVRAGRKSFDSPDPFVARPDEVVAAAHGAIMYGGRYTVRDNTITHHVEISLFPNWIGQDQVRLFRLEDDTLTLETPPISIPGSQTRVALMVWRRNK